MTNSTSWGTSDDPNAPSFYFPRITATGDNRFVLAWSQFHTASDGSVINIWYGVRSSTGNLVKANTKLTNDTPGYDNGYYYPTLTRLSNNRALVAFSGTQNGGPIDIYYAVLGSDGAIQRAAANLSNDGGDNYRPVAVQLANGRTVVAWTNGHWSGTYRTRFAVLGNAFNILAGPTTLDNLAALTGDSYVSATTDGANRAILTWMDQNYNDRRNLYYALVDGNGSVLTPAMILLASQNAVPHIETSYEGYGNTSYSHAPATPSPTPTRTSTPKPTSTPTPTSTPVGPWAAWQGDGGLILLPPAGTSAVVDYGNLAVPTPLAAALTGAAQFGDGTQAMSTTLTTSAGSATLPLLPAPGAVSGDSFTLTVNVAGIDLERSGLISRPLYLPLLLRR